MTAVQDQATPDRRAMTPARFDYDVFVIHAAADEPFVRGYLMPELGVDPARVLLSSALRPGRPVIAELERGVRLSRATIVVLSPAYLADQRAVLAEQLAVFAQIARTSGGELVPVLRAPCELPLHIQAMVQLDFQDPSTWWESADLLRRLLDLPVPGEPALVCPYPGMRPFTRDDAARFHGREDEIADIIGRLRLGEREIYVIGPSGSGKSSLVAAGLLPRLEREVAGLAPFVVRMLRPGDRPCERIREALAVSARSDTGGEPATGAMTRAGTDAATPAQAGAAVIGASARPDTGEPATGAAAVAGAGTAAAAGAGAAASCDPATAAVSAAISRALAGHPPGSKLLLVIDQLEDLFALASSDQRVGFLALLRALRADPRCVRVLALRADFHGVFVDSPLWAELGGRISCVEVGPLHGDDLRAVIARPAAAAGVYLEPELVERLVGDTAAEPGMLPLLQDTLVQLWERRRRRLITLADYEALGDGERSGLAIAIADRADMVLRSLTPAQEPIALRILLRLVNFGEGRADTRRQQLRGALAAAGDDPDQLDAVYRRLIDERLITAGGDAEHPDARVDLAHEVVISAWPALARWIERWRSDEQRRRQLEDTARAWLARGRGDGGLLDETELAEVAGWRHRAARTLGDSHELIELIAASELHFARLANARAEAERRGKHADELRASTCQQLARSHQETARQLLLDGRPLQALPYLVAARDAGEAGPALRMLFWAAARNLPATPPFEHRGAVAAATFSPDGKRIATASRDCTARVWDAATGAPITPPLDHGCDVETVAFSPDGARIATASNYLVRVWDAATGELVAPPIILQGSVMSAVWSSDGTRLLTASLDHTARVWDATTGGPVGPPLRHSEGVMSAAFSRDGRYAVTASWDHTARVWDAATGRPVTAPLQHSEGVLTAAFSPDGTRIVTASYDRTASVWDAATGRLVAPPLGHRRSVVAAAFSPDGTRIVTASRDHTAQVWDAATGAPVGPALSHDGWVISAAFSPDGTRVVTGSHDGSARLWDAATGRLLTRPLEHQSSVRAAFSPDGTRIVTASYDHTTCVWDALTGAPVSAPLAHVGGLASAAFSPDGARVVTASWDHTARVWHAETSAPITPLLRHDGAVAGAVFSPDGTRVVTASRDHTARLWHATTGAPLAPPLVHAGGVTSAAFSPDGTRVITASSDRTARLWDAATGAPLLAPLEHNHAVVAAAFSPDGALVVTASRDRTAQVWDAATGTRVTPPLLHGRAVTSATFCPYNARVVTASEDRTARVWDAATGQPLSPPFEHLDDVASAAFSPDGNRVVSASRDHTARIWDTRLDRGSAADWIALAERSPYLLINGVLSPRTARPEPGVAPPPAAAAGSACQMRELCADDDSAQHARVQVEPVGRSGG